MEEDRGPTPTWYFAVVIVRNKEGKFLAVNETRNRGWWLPAGRVENGETLIAAANRETKEEAGIDINLEGVLRLEHSVSKKHARVRAIFYATPKDESAPLKSTEDEHSVEAKWLTLAELSEIKKKRGIRGPELLLWGTYLEKGGQVFPMSLIANEMDFPKINGEDVKP